jgi:hypothetical protein
VGETVVKPSLPSTQGVRPSSSSCFFPPPASSRSASTVQLVLAHTLTAIATAAVMITS